MNQSPGSSTTSVEDLFARARAGDQAAWEELFRTCYPKLRRVIRRRLDAPLRSLYDSADIANDVFKSLAAKSDRYDFTSFEALLSYLAEVAENKIIDESRRQKAQLRDLRKTRRLGVDDDAHRLVDLASTDPTPSQVAVANETRERILRDQPEPLRAVLVLKGQHYSTEEAAGEAGIPVRTVQRALVGLKRKLGLADGGRS